MILSNHWNSKQKIKIFNLLIGFWCESWSSKESLYDQGLCLLLGGDFDLFWLHNGIKQVAYIYTLTF